jgi:NADPH:quinone reductase-like Zn-dependent oxidoreductase
MPKQVQFNLGDKFEDIKAVEVSKPSIEADNQVLVKFLLNPVNPSDISSLSGHYKGFQPTEYPAVPGVSLFDFSIDSLYLSIF